MDIIIFGTGSLSEKAYYKLKDACNIKYFCDNNPNKWNKEYYNIKIIEPIK